MEKYVENWDQRKDVENDEKCDGMCERCCGAGRANIQICRYLVLRSIYLQGVAQGCTLSPNPFKVYMNDLIVAVEAAKQGVTMGGDTVSGLMFADDFVRISETPEGLQKTDRKGTS